MTLTKDDWDGTTWKVTYAEGDIGSKLPLNAAVTIKKLTTGKLEVTLAAKPQEIIEEYDHDGTSGTLLRIKPQGTGKFFCCAIHLVPGGSNLSIASVRFVIGDILPGTTGVWGAGGA